MIVEWLRQANKVVVFTGAGMSTESGLPDFRSAQGLWRNIDPSTLATVEAMQTRPQQFFDFYRMRIMGVRDSKPHIGYSILADWERRNIIQTIITQNVDGFHAQAGSQTILQLHGTLGEVHCAACGTVYSNEKYAEQTYYCQCGGTLRPSVVLFGEMLDDKTLLRASAASEKADVFIVLGSSLSVAPANQFPLIAKEYGAKLIIINEEPTAYDDYADLVVHDQKIGDWLVAVNEALKL